jgi:hypothetical protein
MAEGENPPQILSLGAGVQSTALLLLSALGKLPKLDGAIFSDTGWEPRAVYDHLDRIEREIAQPAGIPIYRVSSGNIRNDALDPAHRFASMPLYIKNRDGGDGMTRRQCTSEYKLKPIKEQVRRLLGAPDREDGKPGRVPAGRYVEQWVGISTDERDRALDIDGNLKTGDVLYSRNRYPLLELDMSREQCIILLTKHGFGSTPKSACIGCPFHTNRQWRQLRDDHPSEWRDAVEFDAAIRAGSARANANGKPLLGEAYLHRSRLPLSEAPIDRVGYREWAARQSDALTMLALEGFEESLEDDGPLTGCSPFSCRSGNDDEEQDL